MPHTVLRRSSGHFATTHEVPAPVLCFIRLQPSHLRRGDASAWLDIYDECCRCGKLAVPIESFGKKVSKDLGDASEIVGMLCPLAGAPTGSKFLLHFKLVAVTMASNFEEQC